MFRRVGVSSIVFYKKSVKVFVRNKIYNFDLWNEKREHSIRDYLNLFRMKRLGLFRHYLFFFATAYTFGFQRRISLYYLGETHALFYPSTVGGKETY
ncbi:hypothetical protein SAMN05216323_10323 [Williamwhitmania taraxaci]|uniref:Uncharacterized protein n=1 Tax=Williamwhitmania taraxaci TaxID=1640674 RepID=A0A1G6LN72_9BACT|nr:hypothetical protein SAMN05216323_10323 [Williamwhitmania taraxaci]